MKKLMLITNLYPHKYNVAAGVFVQYQALELAKHYEVCVVATCDKYPYEEELSNSSDMQVRIVYYPYWKRYFLTSLFTYRLLALPVVKRCYKDWQPDLIFVHNYRHVPELVWLRPWLNTLNLPTYITLHNIRTHPDRLAGNPLRWFYKQGLSLALKHWTHIFTVNPRLAEWVKPYAKVNSVTVLGNAITVTVPVSDNLLTPYCSKLSTPSYRIISVGNLVVEKGFDILIKAVNELVKEGFDLQVLIVGDGEERAKLSGLISDSNLKNRVFLAGKVENMLVRNLYSKFDAFVLPSYSETFGIVYLEAMFAGKPVIGIEGQGIDGFVTPGVHALFAKPRDNRDLADKIKFLINNPEAAHAMAQSAGSFVKANFMLPVLMQRVFDVLESSTSNRVTDNPR